MGSSDGQARLWRHSCVLTPATLNHHDTGDRITLALIAYLECYSAIVSALVWNLGSLTSSVTLGWLLNQQRFCFAHL